MKIKDRVFLGMLSGVAGNIAKNSLMRLAEKRGLSKKNFLDIAAGFFLPRNEISTPLGRAVGRLGDLSIALAIGTANAFHLTLTGRDYWVWKGLATGSISWLGLYGFLGSMERNQSVYPVSAKTALSSFAGHCVFGLASSFVISELGDDSLFERCERQSARKPVPTTRSRVRSVRRYV